MGLLTVNQTIKSKNGNVYTVKRQLGAGCQGEVYEAADKRKNSVALKIYYHDKLKQLHGGYERQYDIISDLVLSRSPDKRMAWPYDFVNYNNTFGYVMSMVPKGYVSVKKFLTDPQYYLSGTFNSRIRFCYYLAEVFQKVHLMGYSYGDVSDNNIMIRPETGDIMVIDNDNVVVNGEVANILGTPEFIAPELFKANAAPNRQSDLYSLAVLLFKTLYLSHPLLGRREPPMMSKDDEFELFINHPVFIYDPTDNSNRPDPSYHKNAIVYWNIYPKFINRMFIRAFTEGMKDPSKRIYESEWKTALLQLENLQLTCYNKKKNGDRCNAGNFFDKEKTRNKCWNCGAVLESVRLLIKSNVSSEIVLNIDPPSKISEHHIYNNDKIDDYVGMLVRNPSRPDMIGIKNMTDKPWKFVKPNGGTVEVGKNQAIPIVLGGKIIFDEKRKITAEIVR